MASYPPDLEAYVEWKIKTGEFHSRDELTAEALRLYRAVEQRHDRLKADLAAALDQARRGESEPLNLDELRQELLNDLDEQGNLR